MTDPVSFGAKSIRAYFFDAFRRWAADNGYTPCIMVGADAEGVQVPTQYVEDGRILLDISPNAVDDLCLDDDVVSFKAYFSGVARTVRIPLRAVGCVYVAETGRALDFSSTFFTDDDVPAPARDRAAADDDDEPPVLRLVD